LPSKHTALGLAITVLSLLLGIVFYYYPRSPTPTDSTQEPRPGSLPVISHDEQILVVNGLDAGASYASTHCVYAVAHGPGGGTAAPGGVAGRGGAAIVAGNGIAYGGPGGEIPHGGIAGDGGVAFVGGNGKAFGGPGGDSVSNDSWARAPTPKDLGLPEQFWNAGQPGGPGLAMATWGDEGNTSEPQGTVIFAGTNVYHFTNNLVPRAMRLRPPQN
jgi:hypothetical protein